MERLGSQYDHRERRGCNSNSFQKMPLSSPNATVLQAEENLRAAPGGRIGSKQEVSTSGKNYTREILVAASIRFSLGPYAVDFSGVYSIKFETGRGVALRTSE